MNDTALFLLLRLVLVEVTFADVRDRQEPAVQRDGDPPPHFDVTSSQAEFLYKIAQEDSAATDEKVKQLLTLSSSLATLALVFGRDARPKWLYICFVSALVAAVVLCLSIIEVRRGQVPTLEGTDPEGRAWGRDLYASYRVNRGLHNSRTNRYLAARRYFLSALLVLLVLAITTPPPDPTRPLEKAIRRIFVIPTSQPDSGPSRPTPNVMPPQIKPPAASERPPSATPAVPDRPRGQSTPKDSSHSRTPSQIPPKPGRDSGTARR